MATVCGGDPEPAERRRAASASRWPASPWAWSRTATASWCSATSWARRTTSATWTSRWRAPRTGITGFQMDIKIAGAALGNPLAGARAGPRGTAAHPGDHGPDHRGAARRHLGLRPQDHHPADRPGQDRRGHRPRRQDDQEHHREAPAPRSTSRTTARSPSTAATRPGPRPAQEMIKSLVQEPEVGKLVHRHRAAHHGFRRLRRVHAGQGRPGAHLPHGRRSG